MNEKDLLLRQHFFKTQEAYPPGNIDKLLIAMATIPGQTVDNVFTEEVINLSCLIRVAITLVLNLGHQSLV